MKCIAIIEYCSCLAEEEFMFHGHFPRKGDRWCSVWKVEIPVPMLVANDRR